MSFALLSTLASGALNPGKGWAIRSLPFAGFSVQPDVERRYL